MAELFFIGITFVMSSLITALVFALALAARMITDRMAADIEHNVPREFVSMAVPPPPMPRVPQVRRVDTARGIAHQNPRPDGPAPTSRVVRKTADQVAREKAEQELDEYLRGEPLEKAQ